jgi:hypothetical protein
VSLRRLGEWEARIDVWLYLSLVIQDQKPVHRDGQEGIVPQAGVCPLRLRRKAA